MQCHYCRKGGKHENAYHNDRRTGNEYRLFRKRITRKNRCTGTETCNGTECRRRSRRDRRSHLHGLLCTRSGISLRQKRKMHLQIQKRLRKLHEAHEKMRYASTGKMCALYKNAMSSEECSGIGNSAVQLSRCVFCETVFFPRVFPRFFLFVT